MTITRRGAQCALEKAAKVAGLRDFYALRGAGKSSAFEPGGRFRALNPHCCGRTAIMPRSVGHSKGSVAGQVEPGERAVARPPLSP